MDAHSINIQLAQAKAQVVERLNQAQKHQPDTNQQNFAATVRQEIQEENQKANASSEAEEGKILLDNKDTLSLSQKKKKKKKHSDKKKPDQEESSEAKGDEKGQIIDISI